jgi:hypothetical protein
MFPEILASRSDVQPSAYIPSRTSPPTSAWGPGTLGSSGPSFRTYGSELRAAVRANSIHWRTWGRPRVLESGKTHYSLRRGRLSGLVESASCYLTPPNSLLHISCPFELLMASCVQANCGRHWFAFLELMDMYRIICHRSVPVAHLP